MFLKFLKLEFKSFFRSQQFGMGVLMKIGMLYLLLNFAIVFFGGAFGLYFIAKEEGLDPLMLFCRFFLFYWFADLVIKYFIQQMPAENIKPFLGMNIKKNQIVGYTLAKILVSFFSWAFLLFIIPFTILLLSGGGYNALGVIAIAVMSVSMVFINTFINIVINKKEWLMYAIFAGIAAVAGLHYFEVIDLLNFSGQVFYAFYQNWIWSLFPLVLMLALGFYTFRFIRSSLFLDKGLEMKKSVGRTENIAFLNRYGVVGTFINNDIKLIKRSKAARSAFIGGIVFLFYGLLFFYKGYDTGFMQIFLGIFVTGGFNLVFGQRVPAWDSSYYPLMMTQNVPYKEYLKAKWAMFFIGIMISMVLAIGYAFISWEFYFTILAAGIYNLGVNSYLTLLSGAYNKKPVDLNSASKGFTSGQNNFNLKAILITIPQLALPMAVFGTMKYFFGMVPAVASIAFLGLIGFLLKDRIFDLIVRIYKTEKYSTIAAFKQGV